MAHDHDHDHGHGHKRPSRRSVIGRGAALGLAVPLSRVTWAATPKVTQEMARAANAWLSSLDEPRRNAAQLAWSPQREDWHYVPRGRPGIAHRAHERHTNQSCVGPARLAPQHPRPRPGPRHAHASRASWASSPATLSFRDPGNYALVVFGDPAGTAPWAWRFEGHHLSLSAVVAPGHGVSVTPAFFGANPATVPESHSHGGFRLLGAEEDAAFGLIRSLEGGNRTQSLISATLARRHRLGSRSRGVAAAHARACRSPASTRRSAAASCASWNSTPAPCARRSPKQH